MARIFQSVAARLNQPILVIFGSLTLAATLAGAAEEQKPAPDAIKAAGTALQSLKAVSGVPGADKQVGVASIEAPPIIVVTSNSEPVLSQNELRRDPTAAAKAVQSGKGWLVEAMTGGQGKDLASPLAGVEVAAVAPPANPMNEYLSSWLSSRDYSLLVTPSGPAPGGMTIPGDMAPDTAGMIPNLAGQGRVAASPVGGMRENPFLQAVTSPAASAGAARIEAIPATRAAPAYRPPSEPSQGSAKNEPVVDFAKSADDAKYFPQLKRF